MSNLPKPEKLTREQQAMREIGVTDISPRLAMVMTVLFCALMVVVPLWEEFTARRNGRVPHHWSVSGLVPTRAEVSAIVSSGSPWQATVAANSRIMRDIKAYEDGIKEDSTVVQALVPIMQVPISGWLRGGNEDAYLGRDGWVFYRRDIDHLIGPAFLDPRRLAARAAGGDELKGPPQPDPVLAIIDFRDQLARRGIVLVVVPVPTKASIHPERFSARYAEASAPVLNPSWGPFLARLRAAGVAALDLAPVLWQARAQGTVYLDSDTHWTPAGMQTAAEAIAATVRGAVELAPSAVAYRSTPQAISGLGDSAGQLRLPSGWFPPQAVTVHTVERNAGGTWVPWRADPGADVLLLGDSFSNIFSLAGMGWGEAAGLAERLSVALERPVDALLRNDAGSHATRQMLAAELARGRDRLAGKRVVVWEFAARELSHGDWKLLPMTLGARAPSAFWAPEAPIAVRATVVAVAAAPRPGTVPYRDHVVAVRLADIEAPGTDLAGREVFAYVQSMRDNVWTAAARWRPGERVGLRLQPWSAVADRLDGLNRAELADDDLLTADPVHAQPVE